MGDIEQKVATPKKIVLARWPDARCEQRGVKFKVGHRVAPMNIFAPLHADAQDTEDAAWAEASLAALGTAPAFKGPQDDDRAAVLAIRPDAVAEKNEMGLWTIVVNHKRTWRQWFTGTQPRKEYLSVFTRPTEAMAWMSARKTLERK